MRTHLLPVVLLMLASSLLVAAPAEYFSTYGAAYNVDLSATAQYPGTGDSSNADYDVTEGYNPTTLIAFLGASGTSGEDVTITISKWYTEPWMYQSASQPNLQRPFGIDFVTRERWYHEENPWIIDEEEQKDITGKAPDHFGYQDRYAYKEAVEYTFTKDTDGSVSAKGYEIGSKIVNSLYDFQLVSSWVDMVLVLPELDSDDNSYQIGSANDYYASFDIKISGGGVDMTYHCELTGYYMSDKPGNMDISLSVIPNANAGAINLDDTTGFITPKTGSGLHVADYSYTTTKESSNNDLSSPIRDANMATSPSKAKITEK